MPIEIQNLKSEISICIQKAIVDTRFARQTRSDFERADGRGKRRLRSSVIRIPLGGARCHKVVYRAAQGFSMPGLVTLRLISRCRRLDRSARRRKRRKTDVSRRVRLFNRKLSESGNHLRRIFLRLKSRNGNDDGRRPRYPSYQHRNAG